VAAEDAAVIADGKPRGVLLGAHSFGAGALFGAGLILSGMYDPGKVRAFLDITGKWDPSLAFVMAGAIAVAAPAFLLARVRRNHGRTAWSGESLPGNPSRRIDSRLVVGTILFGVGWGLSGFCPGPALVSIGLGARAAFPFIAAMFAGVALHGLLRWKAPAAN
jgi:uncharacterized membrane protein YedE/YeeE